MNMHKYNHEVDPYSAEVLNETPLAANFYAIKEKPDIKEPAVEEFNDIFENELYHRHCFDMAKNSFIATCQESAVAESLTSQPSKENLKYLRRVRRYGLIFKANYNFFDKSHKIPDNFRQFLKALGKHNDNYLQPDRENLAHEVINNPEFWEDLNTQNFTFYPVSEKELHEYTNSLLSEIGAYFLQKTVSVIDFHNLRKRIRLIADVLQVPASEDLGGKIHWLFASLLEISVKLGEQHDSIIQGQFSQSEVPEVITIDPLLIRKFYAFKPYINKVLGLEK